MGRGSRCTLAVFLAFLLFSVLLACCSPAQRPTNELTEDLLMRTLPSSLGVRRRDIRPIQHGSEEAREYCVFYEVGEGIEIFTDALIYRLADTAISPLTASLPSLRPYTFSLPHTDTHLCECSCNVGRADLLKGYNYQQDDELIVWDQCEDRTPRLFIYHWIPEVERYESFGYFDAYDIRFNHEIPNEITVDYETRPGAEWVYRCLYEPCPGDLQIGEETLSKYNSTCPRRDFDCEFVFYGKTPSPREIRESPYLGTVLLGFYKSYSDWDVTRTFFTGTVDADFCAEGRCGCTSPLTDVNYVTVKELVIDGHGCVDTNVCYEDHPESFLYDWTLIEALVACETDENGEEERWVTWLVARVEGGGWRLVNIFDEGE
jgi:hypothetical protein